MFCFNFMKMNRDEKISTINVDEETKWLPLDKIYCGITAQESLLKLLPHERESFLKRCRDWYREAVRQILDRIPIRDPVLNALRYVDHKTILNGTASIQAAGILAKGLPRPLEEDTIIDIDRQWRMLLIDDDMKDGNWEKKSILKFCKGCF